MFFVSVVSIYQVQKVLTREKQADRKTESQKEGKRQEKEKRSPLIREDDILQKNV